MLKDEQKFSTKNAESNQSIPQKEYDRIKLRLPEEQSPKDFINVFYVIVITTTMKIPI